MTHVAVALSLCDNWTCSITKRVLTARYFTTDISTRSILWRLHSTKICFRPGLCPGPRWESSRHSPRLLSLLGQVPSPFPTPLCLHTVPQPVLALQPRFLDTHLSAAAHHFLNQECTRMQNFWWRRPVLPAILFQADLVRAKTHIFNRYSLVAPLP